jgi:hypothetical protein
VWSYIFKLIIAIIFIYCGFYACKEIPRDNVLDPKNPDSQRAQIVAIEAFVNTNNEDNYNEVTLEALNQLQDKYPNKLTIVQYHRNVGEIEDPLYGDLAKVEILYETYVNAFQPGTKGVPDVYFNATAARIQGASIVSKTLLRLEEELQPFLVQNSFFTIEADVKREGSQVTISCQVARLGAAEANDILVKAIIIENIDNQIHKRVVRDIMKSNIISRLIPGEVKEIKFDNFEDTSNSELKVIFNITSENELEIFQSEEVQVP